MSQTDNTAGYSITASITPSDWFYSDETQRLVNKLPMHSAIRQERHSVGQTFLNGVAGVSLQDAREKSDLYTRMLYPTLAPLDEIDVISQVELPGYISTSEPTLRINYLPNSGFDIWTTPNSIPNNWYKYGTVQVSSGLEGTNAIRLIPSATKQRSGIYQILTQRIKSGEAWVLSCWYKIPTNSLIAPTTSFGLKTTFLYYDNTTLVTEKIFLATTNSSWNRLKSSLLPTKDVVSIKIEVIVADQTSFAFYGNYVDIDCMQFEKGGVASPWRPDILDDLPYSSNVRKNNILLVGGESTFYTDNLDDFWYQSIPTRIEYLESLSGSYDIQTTAGSLLMVDYFKEEWRFTFEVNVSKIRKRGLDVPGDILVDYDIAIPTPGGFYRLLEGITIEALALFGGYLFASVLEWDANTQPIRTIRILNYKTPHPEPNYLLSLSGIKIDSSIPLSANIVRMEFKNEDRQHIYLSTTTTQYVVRLHYDLFIVDVGNGVLYTREPITSVAIV